MKINTKNILLLTLLTLFSCENNVENQLENKNPTVEDKETIINNLIADTTKRQYEVKEAKENLAKIEQKYGEQWGFCECVVANDSINKAINKITDFETPETEKIMSRWDYVTEKCQAYLVMDANKTPEEREKHDRKVKKCLRDAKK